MLRVICGFHGAYEGLKLRLELDEEDEVRLSRIQQLEAPLRDCKKVLDRYYDGVESCLMPLSATSATSRKMSTRMANACCKLTTIPRTIMTKRKSGILKWTVVFVRLT